MDAVSALSGGFAEPVFAAQATFRVLMDAMARPGTVGCVEFAAAAPAALGPAQAALALTLADGDTPVWIDPAEAGAEMATWLAFHAGARLVADPGEAAFAFLAVGAEPPSGLPLGSDDYPDRSATVILEVAEIGAGSRFLLEGPGIGGTREIAVAGLFAGFAAFRRDNRALFPRGLDCVLTAGERLLALPRSTVLRPLEA